MCRGRCRQAQGDTENLNGSPVLPKTLSCRRWRGSAPDYGAVALYFVLRTFFPNADTLSSYVAFSLIQPLFAFLDSYRAVLLRKIDGQVAAFENLGVDRAQVRAFVTRQTPFVRVPSYRRTKQWCSLSTLCLATFWRTVRLEARPAFLPNLRLRGGDPRRSLNVDSRDVAQTSQMRK